MTALEKHSLILFGFHPGVFVTKLLMDLVSLKFNETFALFTLCLQLATSSVFKENVKLLELYMEKF